MTPEDQDCIAMLQDDLIYNDPLYKQGFQAGAASRDAEVAELKQQLETERLRLAACGVAALGYFDGCNDEYRSASLGDVQRLVEKNDQLHADNVRLQFALADTEALELSHGEVIEKLRTHINVLLKALQLTQDQAIRGRIFPATASPSAWFNAVTIALASTTEQSLAEYRNKVIEAFVNEFTRHVGGDGEFWLHELQDFAMKEQP